MAALRMKTTKDPFIAKVWDESSLWHRYGIRLDPRDGPDRSEREIEALRTLTNLTIKWENFLAEARARAARTPVVRGR